MTAISAGAAPAALADDGGDYGGGFVQEGLTGLVAGEVDLAGLLVLFGADALDVSVEEVGQAAEFFRREVGSELGQLALALDEFGLDPGVLVGERRGAGFELVPGPAGPDRWSGSAAGG